MDRRRADPGHRPRSTGSGRTEPVTAWRIIAAQTIDTKIAELIDSKAGLAARALDGSDEEVAVLGRRPARGAGGAAHRCAGGASRRVVTASGHRCAHHRQVVGVTGAAA